MIENFRCKETRQLWEMGKSRRFNSITMVALRKLAMLDAAENLEDLRVPPANRLEALRGDRKGLHSIRVNDQWRVCFRWEDGRVLDVEIVDYH
jgi:proteic killer suppression protein